ncbi:MAG: rhomboid family intramembrane serine protease [bacterium]
MYRLKMMIRTTPMTMGLIIINLVMFMITIASGGFELENLVRLGAMVPAFVSDGEYYRILSSMFLHGGWLHFVMNMMALYYLGMAMERGIGSYRYFALYMLSGLGGSFAIVLFGAPYDVTIGASGALFGIMAGMLYITFRRKNWFTPASNRSIRTMMILNLAITFLVSSISVYGHLGGFAVGLLLSFPLIPKIPYFLGFRRPTPVVPDSGDDDNPPLA